MRCGFPDSTWLPGDPDGTANNPHHRHATTHTHTVHTLAVLPLIAHTRRNCYSNYQAHTQPQNHTRLPQTALQCGALFQWQMHGHDGVLSY